MYSFIHSFIQSIINLTKILIDNDGNDYDNLSRIKHGAWIKYLKLKIPNINRELSQHKSTT